VKAPKEYNELPWHIGGEPIAGPVARERVAVSLWARGSYAAQDPRQPRKSLCMAGPARTPEQIAARDDARQEEPSVSVPFMSGRNGRAKSMKPPKRAPPLGLPALNLLTVRRYQAFGPSCLAAKPCLRPGRLFRGLKIASSMERSLARWASRLVRFTSAAWSSNSSSDIRSSFLARSARCLSMPASDRVGLSSRGVSNTPRRSPPACIPMVPFCLRIIAPRRRSARRRMKIAPPTWAGGGWILDMFFEGFFGHRR
jgi:hypothetical protein